MDDKRVAYVEDVVNELSDMIDKSFKTIIDNKKFVMPDFESVISKRTLDLEQIDFLQELLAFLKVWQPVLYCFWLVQQKNYLLGQPISSQVLPLSSQEQQTSSPAPHPSSDPLSSSLLSSSSSPRVGDVPDYPQNRSRKPPLIQREDN